METKAKTGFKEKLLKLKNMGKNIDYKLPLNEQNHVRLIEYISLLIAKIGFAMSGTVIGSYASVFLYSYYFGAVGLDTGEAGKWLSLITIITTLAGFLISGLVSTITYKWKTKYGRYRQWYLMCSIPAAIVLVLNFVVPDPAIKTEGFVAFKLIIMLLLTVFFLNNANELGGFLTMGGNIIHVISPNQKEKKKIVVLQQIGYYIGYGGAYVAAAIFGVFYKDSKWMFLGLAIATACILVVGTLMVAIFCKERIDNAQKNKVKVTKDVLNLFKIKNYRAYHYARWSSFFAATGVMISYLAAIVVGSENAAAFALPSAIGTGIGVILCMLVSKKIKSTRILQIVGLYTPLSAILCFVTTYFTGFGSGYYITYFLFGLNFGFAELATNNWTVEFNDYLEWKTGKRQEAIQGIIPEWINQGLGLLKSGVIIPLVILPLIGYKTGSGDSYLEFMKAQPGYEDTCNWLLAFALFGISITRLLNSFIITFLYKMPKNDEKLMIEELEVIRKNRMEIQDASNVDIENNSISGNNSADGQQK